MNGKAHIISRAIMMFWPDGPLGIARHQPPGQNNRRLPPANTRVEACPRADGAEGLLFLGGRNCGRSCRDGRQVDLGIADGVQISQQIRHLRDFLDARI